MARVGGGPAALAGPAAGAGAGAARRRNTGGGGGGGELFHQGKTQTIRCCVARSG